MSSSMDGACAPSRFLPWQLAQSCAYRSATLPVPLRAPWARAERALVTNTSVASACRAGSGEDMGAGGVEGQGRATNENDGVTRRNLRRVYNVGPSAACEGEQ